MVISDKARRRIYWGMGLLALLAVLRCQIVDIAWERSNKIVAEKKKTYKPEISEEELNSFIKLWPEFKKLGLADDLIVSYRIDKPSKFVDWKTHIWFVYHKWDADRFFYVQQRIAAMLHTLGVKRNATALIAHLEERDDELSKDMIELQKQRLKAENLESEELEMIQRKENILKKLLDES